MDSFFALVFFSFPSFMPVTAGTMNYVSVVIVIYLLWTLIYWWFPVKGWACRDNFAGGRGNDDEEEFPDVCLDIK